MKFETHDMSCCILLLTDIGTIINDINVWFIGTVAGAGTVGFLIVVIVILVVK